MCRRITSRKLTPKINYSAMIEWQKQIKYDQSIGSFEDWFQRDSLKLEKTVNKDRPERLANQMDGIRGKVGDGRRRHFDYEKCVNRFRRSILNEIHGAIKPFIKIHPIKPNFRRNTKVSGGRPQYWLRALGGASEYIGCTSRPKGSIKNSGELRPL